MKSSIIYFSINCISNYESIIAVLVSLMKKIVPVLFQMLTVIFSITAISVSSHPYFGRADDEDLMWVLHFPFINLNKKYFKKNPISNW